MENNIHSQIAQTVLSLKQEVRWKPGSAERHLRKRQKRKHLPETATQDDYDALIRRVINDRDAEVRLYWHENIPYIPITGFIDENVWLVMFSMKGIMETAFIVRHPGHYMKGPEYEYIGYLHEVMP